jgi:hypothetical protein
MDSEDGQSGSGREKGEGPVEEKITCEVFGKQDLLPAAELVSTLTTVTIDWPVFSRAAMSKSY